MEVFSVQIIFTTFVMVGVKMLGIRIHLDRDKRYSFRNILQFCHKVGEQSRDISKNQNNGRVAPSRWYRSFVFMSDIDSCGTAALIWSIRNGWSEDGKAPTRWSCHRLQVLSWALQGMWPRIHGGVWLDPTGPEDRGYLLWRPRSGEIPILFVTTTDTYVKNTVELHASHVRFYDVILISW